MHHLKRPHRLLNIALVLINAALMCALLGGLGLALDDQDTAALHLPMQGVLS